MHIKVEWNVPALVVGQTVETPELTAIMDEIRSRPGFVEGNNVGFIFSYRTGERDPLVHDGARTLSLVFIFFFSFFKLVLKINR